MGTDVTPARKTLEFHGIQYEMAEEGGSLVLYVDRDAHIGEVIELLRESVREIQHEQEVAGLKASPNLSVQLHRTPVMITCLLLSILGAIIPSWSFGLLHWITFQDFVLVSPNQINFSTLTEALNKGQYWRLITPIFIHFGIFHILFNGLWLWEFGRRIETVAGSFNFLMLVLVTGVVSNFSQYIWSGASLFGGMSGVIFGMLGFIWIGNKFSPHPGFLLPKGIIGLMIGWLLICMTGVIDILFQGSIANAAHAAGLLVGMAMGAIFGIANRRGWSA